MPSFTKIHCPICKKISSVRQGQCSSCQWAKLRLDVINFLGGECVCCGEININFLTVDHINNDGYLSRNENGIRSETFKLYNNLITDINAKKKYQVLCFNCNCGRDKQFDKICPHQKFDYMTMVSAC